MYASSNNTATTHGKDYAGTYREHSRKAPPTPPSPKPSSASSSPHRDGNRENIEIPWGDRKQAANIPKMVKSGDDRKPISIANANANADANANVNANRNRNTNHASTFQGVSEADIEIEINFEGTFVNAKDGVSPQKSKSDPRSAFNSLEKKANGSDGADSNGSHPDERSHAEIVKSTNRDRMSKRELFWAAFVFALIVILTVAITAIVMIRQTRGRNIQKNASRSNNNSNNNSGNGMTSSPTGTPPNMPPSTNGGSGGITGTTESLKISIQEEWDLVYSVIRDNNVTRVLLQGRDAMEQSLPHDLYFYEKLVSGMYFSEEDRDWIPAPPQYEIDDLINIDGMSMGGTFKEFGGNRNDYNKYIATTISKKLTPNQKATAWLLFHDDRKDPNESVWRWAMASIYFKMGGDNWDFHNNVPSKNKWFTSAPLCEWDRLYGSSGCDKHKQQIGTPLLPVELDFDDSNMVGAIAIEFALLLLPNSNPVTGTSATTTTNTNTLVRSITLTDNRLTGTIPGAVFQHLMPSLGKLYLDNNQLTGTVPLELGGLDTLYVQNNVFTGDWPQEFCDPGNKTVDDFGLDCDKVECSCCGIFHCYYSKL